MDRKKTLWLVITLIFIMGIGGASSLVYNEFTNGLICPKLIGIPACYIIMLCFLIPFISHLFNLHKLYYYIGTGLAFSIALYGSVMQLLRVVECPKTNRGLPMCFISLSIFTGLIILKLISLKKPSRSSRRP